MPRAETLEQGIPRLKSGTQENKGSMPRRISSQMTR